MTALSVFLWTLLGVPSVEVLIADRDCSEVMDACGALGMFRPELTVEAGKESRAQRILEKVHDFCLTARPPNCPVDMEPVVKTG